MVLNSVSLQAQPTPGRSTGRQVLHLERRPTQLNSVLGTIPGETLIPLGKPVGQLRRRRIGSVPYLSGYLIRRESQSNIRRWMQSAGEKQISTEAGAAPSGSENGNGWAVRLACCQPRVNWKTIQKMGNDFHHQRTAVEETAGGLSGGGRPVERVEKGMVNDPE